MTTSQDGINMIKRFESCRLKAYQDIAGIWTIGFGATMLKNGDRVKAGNRITQAVADDLLAWQIKLKEGGVNNCLKPYNVNQNQFDALVSFTYNVGIGALADSTLLKKIKKDVNDPTIADEFSKWCKAKVNGKYVEVEGLKKRRAKEAALYFKVL